MHRFIVAHSANALSIGVQLVLVAWLAAGVLHLAPEEIGWVQAAVLLPNLLLLLVAGVFADRHHPAHILCWSNIGLGVTHCVAAWLVANQRLDAVTLFGYALAIGVGNTFVQTAREKLVAQFAGEQLQRTISIAGICQFAAQGVGIMAASLTDFIGPSLLLLLQAALCAIAAVTYGSLSRHMAPGHDRELTVRKAVAEGMQWVAGHKAVRHVLCIVGFNGFMHLGMFIVILPILARDQMGFSSFEYGLLQLSFAAGSVLSQIIILRKQPLRFPGQNVLFCLLYSGVIGFALSGKPTLFGLYSLIFLWGTVAAGSANLSRLVIQSAIPATHRGRTMAVYQLALFGMAPLGALFAGYLVQHSSVWVAFKVIGWSSAVLFAASLLTRDLWAVQPQSDASEASKDRPEGEQAGGDADIK